MCTVTAAIIGSVVGTMGSAYMQGRAQQQQYEAQARQAEANARLQAQQAEVAQQNALRANKNAEEMARANAENVEMQRRKNLLYEGAQKAKISASGITATGSALNALADTRWDIDRETAAQLYSGQQNVYKQFGVGTDYANQSADYRYQESVYKQNADDYRSAGKKAMSNALIGGLFGVAGSLSGSLYSSKSSAAQAAGGGVVGNYKDGYQLSSYASGAGSWNAAKNGLTWNSAYSKLPKYAQY